MSMYFTQAHSGKECSDQLKNVQNQNQKFMERESQLFTVLLQTNTATSLIPRFAMVAGHHANFQRQ